MAMTVTTAVATTLLRSYIRHGRGSGDACQSSVHSPLRTVTGEWPAVVIHLYQLHLVRTSLDGWAPRLFIAAAFGVTPIPPQTLM